MKKTLKLIFCIVILGSSLFPMLGTLAGIDSPNLDKNARSPFPSWVNNGKINWSYTIQFDDFYTDNFSFRTYLISLYNGIFEQLIKTSGNRQVIVGEDSFLFFEETLDDYLKVNQLSDHDTQRLNEVLRIQNGILNKLAIKGYFMVIPNKAKIYGECMPKNLQILDDLDSLDKIRESLNAMEFVDVYPALMDEKEKSADLLYHKRDSHWNDLGAAIGYKVLMEALGKDYLLLDQPTEKTDWQGDLDRMLYPAFPRYDEQFYFPLPGKFIFTKAIRSFEDLEIVSGNPDKTGKLVMFRDSFANALIPFLSESFNEVNYFRNFPADFTKIPSDTEAVIFQVAQRNINWYLQATPIASVSGRDETVMSSRSIYLDFSVELQKKADLYYLNARFTDQAKAQKITAFRIKSQEYLYDAFPIYQDADFEDDIIELGFSLYTSEPIDPKSMQVYGYLDGQWVKIEQ